MKGWAGRIALAFVAFAFAGGVAELALRLSGYEPLHAVYSSPELFWRHDAQLGWSLEPGARGRYRGPRPFPVEFDTEIAINSLGLRGPELGPRAPGELRVLVLGDSVVAGFEVEQAETFVALAEAALERRLAEPVRVVNAGVRGYGTDQSLLWWREHGAPLAPDVVVLAFSTNDFEDNLTLHRPRRPFGKGAFALRPNGRLELVGVPVPEYQLCSAWSLGEGYTPERTDGLLARGVCALETRLADRSALFTFVATALARLPGVLGALRGAPEGKREQPLGASLVPWPFTEARSAGAPGAPSQAPTGRTLLERDLTTALLQALARDVRASGARFLLVITPWNWERLDARALRADRIVPVAITVEGGFSPAELRFRNDSHFNALGHRLYAERLVELLEPELRAALRSRAPR